MAYERVNWTNTPTTKINATNLNHMDSGIAANDVSINATNNQINALATFPNQTYNLIPNHVNFVNASGWNTVNSGTLTASGALLTAVSESNLRIYADLEKSIPLNANASVLIKIRARCTSGGTATLKPCWRAGSSGVVIDKSYIIAGNVKTADMTWSVGSTFADLWLIAKDGTAQATIDRVGLQISTGATVEIGHFEVFYSQDEGLTNGELEDLQADVNQSRVDIGNLQTDVNGTKDSAGLKTRMSAAEGNITALQGVVNGAETVSGTVKYQIAKAKADVINNSVNPLAQRVTAAEKKVAANETNITNLQKSVKANADNITSLQTATSANADNIATLKSDYDRTVYGQKNLLPNSRDFSVGIVQTTEVIVDGFSDEFGVCNVAYSSVGKSDSVNDKNILEYTKLISASPREEYTLSFWTKGTGRLSVMFRDGGVAVAKISSSVNTTFFNSDAYGTERIELTSDWRKYWVKYVLSENKTSDTPKTIMFKIYKNSNIDVTESYIAAPRLVLGSDIKTDTDRNTAAVTRNTADIAALQAITGYTNDDILGLQVDYQNKTFTRLAGAVGKEAGADFDSFLMYGGRKRCNVANDGTINAYYGDEGYSDTGSNGQVMVYQPAFYYKIVPLKLDKNTDSGIGYHIRKANYYVSATPHAGFKLHPAFYDENGNAVDYILYSAYEGSLYSNHHIVSDDNDTETTWDLSADYLCSYANTKPISGLYKPLTKTNAETLAKNNGTGWHIDTIKSVSANQLLMMIELGTMNTQAAIGMGVVSIADNSSYNCSSLTGSTANLGNTTGMAESTTNRQGSTTTTYTENGKVSVSYRGIENPWGNINKHINGVNIWGDGTMLGGQLYIASDYNFSELSHSNSYKAVGFTMPNATGYIKAMGYGDESYDWLLMPSEIGGSSALPVGDAIRVSSSDLNGYSIDTVGGGWSSGTDAGVFYHRQFAFANYAYRTINCRLLYVPIARI